MIDDKVKNQNLSRAMLGNDNAAGPHRRREPAILYYDENSGQDILIFTDSPPEQIYAEFRQDQAEFDQYRRQIMNRRDYRNQVLRPQMQDSRRNLIADIRQGNSQAQQDLNQVLRRKYQKQHERDCIRSMPIRDRWTMRLHRFARWLRHGQ